MYNPYSSVTYYETGESLDFKSTATSLTAALDKEMKFAYQDKKVIAILMTYKEKEESIAFQGE